ncbi:MAG: protein kinase, partial [Muribaculaceae bacterium]|nr:protein kinase [Muribaculaceae bacterium]
IEGKTLAQMLHEGKISKQERRRIMADIIRAVGFMHGKGVIHRDLKPANVMVRKEGGEIVLIDFGLADTDDYAELKQGAGSPGYVSPEQRRDEGASITDDIYSLGKIMRQLTPEFSRIAARCTGPLRKRPKDTATLLRMIERKKRLPKILAYVAVAAVAATVGGVTVRHIHHLSEEADITRANVTAMTGNNNMIELSIAHLEDSLVRMRSALSEAEEGIHKVDINRDSRRRAYLDAYNRMMREINSFEKNVVPGINSLKNSPFFESVTNLRLRFENIAAGAYDPQRFPELNATDSLKLCQDVHLYGLETLSQYVTKWAAEIYARELNIEESEKRSKAVVKSKE